LDRDPQCFCGGPTIAYESRRRTRTGGAAEFRGRYGPTGPPASATPGTLEFLLVERYLPYERNGRTLSEARGHHRPYQLQPATVADLSETLMSAAGLPRAMGAPTHVHYSWEVDVRVYRPGRVVA